MPFLCNPSVISLVFFGQPFFDSYFILIWFFRALRSTFRSILAMPSPTFQLTGFSLFLLRLFCPQFLIFLRSLRPLRSLCPLCPLCPLRPALSALLPLFPRGCLRHCLCLHCCCHCLFIARISGQTQDFRSAPTLHVLSSSPLHVRA